MSNRSLIEINHDFSPRDSELEGWAKRVQGYLRSGDADYLPLGVRLIDRRHHSEEYENYRKKDGFAAHRRGRKKKSN